jgi:high-affinity nickel-transport protein
MGGSAAHESPPALIPKNTRGGFARRLFAGPPELRARLIGICGVLAVLNAGAWLCALAVFRGTPVSLALMLMIYGLGLRHAVDADHIAAIDNVTRKFMEDRRRPVAVGFFFALGHSAVVLIVTMVVARTARMLGSFQSFRDLGGSISVCVSTLFLLAIAIMNIVVFRSVYKTYRRVRAGGAHVEQDLSAVLNSGGLLSRLFRPLFGLVTRSWHMLPLGFLFGLGFDTATEVAVFSISIAQAAQGVSLWGVLVFPALFAAGMSLVDTTDGVMMLGAYEWAFVNPLRKLYYNMTITLLSVAIALLVGAIEALGLLGHRFRLDGPVWRLIATLNGNFTDLGLFIIGLILLAWALSYLLYQFGKLGQVSVPRTES